MSDLCPAIAVIVGPQGAGKTTFSRFVELTTSGVNRVDFQPLVFSIFEREVLPNSSACDAREAFQEWASGIFAKGPQSGLRFLLERDPELLASDSPVVIDGCQNLAELVFLRENITERVLLVAVWASVQTRMSRVLTREAPDAVRRLQGPDDEPGFLERDKLFMSYCHEDDEPTSASCIFFEADVLISNDTDSERALRQQAMEVGQRLLRLGQTDGG